MPENVCVLSCMGSMEKACGGKNALSLYEVDYSDGVTVE